MDLGTTRLLREGLIGSDRPAVHGCTVAQALASWAPNTVHPGTTIQDNPHDAAILAGGDLTGLVTWRLARAIEPVSRRRAAVFDRVALGLKPLEREVALFAGDRADTVDSALFGVDDGVCTLRVQGTGNGLGRVIVGVLFSFAPKLTDGENSTFRLNRPANSLIVRSPVG